MNDDAILVVDDDEDLRDLVRFVVEPMGVDVIDAATCDEAIVLMGNHGDRVRLILLDYFMPGLEPLPCARELTRLAGSAMIVLCTAAADPAARAAEVGLNRWLAKPFVLDALQQLVREATENRSGTTAARTA